ncbi:hypothetical protein GCM10023088_06330 [Actinomadura verrucosospora]
MRRRLTPRYEPGCKRILASSEYYPTLNRPDVAVVDSPIVEITRHGARTAAGVHHAFDTLIWATGFRSQDFVAPMRVFGAHGQELNAAWKDGARAYLGLAVTGFPNFFLMYGPNTNVGSGSIVHMLESQAAYIVQAARLLAGGATSMDVRAYPFPAKTFTAAAVIRALRAGAHNRCLGPASAIAAVPSSDGGRPLSSPSRCRECANRSDQLMRGRGPARPRPTNGDRNEGEGDVAQHQDGSPPTWTDSVRATTSRSCRA